ncbi:hypothetical protein C8R46DRAFT_1218331 [Mycena filopes]|nr:hypothetical protein C8R46DRAFT_1218331 [Mycena filopes]
MPATPPSCRDKTKKSVWNFRAPKRSLPQAVRHVTSGRANAEYAVPQFRLLGLPGPSPGPRALRGRPPLPLHSSGFPLSFTYTKQWVRKLLVVLWLTVLSGASPPGSDEKFIGGVRLCLAPGMSPWQQASNVGQPADVDHHGDVTARQVAANVDYYMNRRPASAVSLFEMFWPPAGKPRLDAHGSFSPATPKSLKAPRSGATIDSPTSQIIIDRLPRRPGFRFFEIFWPPAGKPHLDLHGAFPPATRRCLKAPRSGATINYYVQTSDYPRQLAPSGISGQCLFAQAHDPLSHPLTNYHPIPRRLHFALHTRPRTPGS